MIARTGSLREAARTLRLSPAALSKAVKLLEADLETQLLAPSGRGIVVTDAGKRVAAQGEELLKSVDRFRAAAATGREAAVAPVRIGSFEVFTTYFLGALIADHLGADTALELHEFVPGHLETAVSEGVIDLGISYIRVPLPDLDHLQVGEVTMGAFTRAGAFARTPFERIPFAVPIQPPYGAPTKAQGLDGWADDRHPRRIGFRVTLMESAIELSRRGLAAAYLPDFVVRLHNRQVAPAFRLERIPVPKGVGKGLQPVYLIKRKSFPENSLVKRVARALRAAALHR